MKWKFETQKIGGKNPKIEHKYTSKKWIIIYDPQSGYGYISRVDRSSVIDKFSKGQQFSEGFGIPNYVVSKVNQLINSEEVHGNGS